jgi:hypothetical protein
MRFGRGGRMRRRIRWVRRLLCGDYLQTRFVRRKGLGMGLRGVAGMAVKEEEEREIELWKKDSCLVVWLL